MFKAAGSYEEALQLWKAPEDVHGWIAASFTYDHPGAIRLSETQRSQEGRLSIYRPSELFDRKAGICVDLARFAVETLKRIDPARDPKYVRIEFEPMQIEGNNVSIPLAGSLQTRGKTIFLCRFQSPHACGGPLS